MYSRRFTIKAFDKLKRELSENDKKELIFDYQYQLIFLTPKVNDSTQNKVLDLLKEKMLITQESNLKMIDSSNKNYNRFQEEYATLQNHEFDIQF